MLTGRRVAGVAATAVGVVVVGGIWQSVDAREREHETRAVIADVRRAVGQFQEDMGRCPYNLRELVRPARTGVRYLQELPVDGWGNPLWVRCPGRYDPEGLDVVSAGPSGNLLADDNIQ